MIGWLLVMVLTVQAAGTAAMQAEHVRIADEMARLVAENRWDGVERHYQTLRALRGVELTYTDHWLGAQAAADQGDVWGIWERLQLAMAVEFTDEAVAWWATLTAQYGEVSIRIHRRHEGERRLHMDSPPMQPQPRAALMAAQEALEQNGAYTGLLPLGMYRIGDTHFDVVGGPTVVVVVR